MKTIFVLSDNSPTASHAMKFALEIAQKAQANVLVAHTVNVNATMVVKAAAGNGFEDILEAAPLFLGTAGTGRCDFRPEVEELDISAMEECKIADLVNKRQIWMMIKGITGSFHTGPSCATLNAHSVLSKVLCPLLMVPETWSVKQIERMVYIADLRYCHTQTVRYLVDLARPWQADVSIANVTAPGLPDMAPEYAQSLFEGAICNHVNYDRLFINNIRERNIGKVVDVLINGLHNDIVVLVNRQFHFEEIMGRYLTDSLPEPITVPMLIFPY